MSEIKRDNYMNYAPLLRVVTTEVVSEKYLFV